MEAVGELLQLAGISALVFLVAIAVALFPEWLPSRRARWMSPDRSNSGYMKLAFGLKILATWRILGTAGCAATLTGIALRATS